MLFPHNSFLLFSSILENDITQGRLVAGGKEVIQLLELNEEK